MAKLTWDSVHLMVALERSWHETFETVYRTTPSATAPNQRPSATSSEPRVSYGAHAFGCSPPTLRDWWQFEPSELFPTTPTLAQASNQRLVAIWRDLPSKET